MDPRGGSQKWAMFPPHYELGSNAAIPLNKEDNHAPQPTISHLETDYRNSIVASFVGQ